MRSQVCICLVSLAGLIACHSDQKYSGGSSKGQTSTPAVAESPEESSSVSEDSPASNEIAPTEAPNEIAPIKAPASVVTPTPIIPGMTPVQVAEQVIKNSQLPQSRKGPMTTSVEDVIVASQSGDQAEVSNASERLFAVALGQAFNGGNGQGFGLLDFAALRKAIKDLIAAAKDGDLDKIKKAVEDIVAAVK